MNTKYEHGLLDRFRESIKGQSDEVTRLDSEMVSFRFISEIDKMMEAKGMSKKELAASIGTSASYITQLFKGDKLLNMETIAKIQAALGIKFEITAVADSDLMAEVFDWNCAAPWPGKMDAGNSYNYAMAA